MLQDGHLQDIVDAAARLPADQRAALIETLTQNLAGPGPPPEHPPRPVSLSDWEGRHVGPYRLTKLLAAGGMGAVYVAERADNQYEMRVAIKVVRPGMNTERIIGRFLQERQVLASLDHPNIARMLDGGTAADGTPYLVMEYVEGGVPIDVYCDEHKLDIRQRLLLLRAVCNALQYAHQNLFVHRDIKPQNILVTPDGTAKLLDFGIAKLLDPARIGMGPQLTLDSAPMTPEYASPEQVRDEPVSTSADIYAMGVVLYRLLTGRSPYALKTRGTTDLLVAITDQVPQRPSDAVRRAGPPDLDEAAALRGATASQLAKQLHGDLDVILLTALQKDPKRRYASAEHLGDDIRRHVEGLPVAARGDTLGYRVGKFVTRHKVAAAATLAFTIALIALTVSSVYFARAARRERSVAVERQMIADRRFHDLRQFARFVVFEFDEAIRGGETNARRLMVAQALGYLNGLSKESENDPAILRDLANAYVKIGDIQGNPYVANLGDGAGAIASYRRAADVADALVRIEPGNPGNATVQGRTRLGLGDLMMQAGDNDGAKRLYGEAARILETAAGNGPPGEAALLAASAMGKLGFLQLSVEGNARAALASLERAVGTAHRAAANQPGNPEGMKVVSAALLGLGRVLVNLGRHREGIARLTEAITVRKQLSASMPGDRHFRREVAASLILLGDALSSNRQADQAADSYREGARVHRELLQADPKNRQFLRDSYVALGRVATAEQQLGHHRQARETTRSALQLLASIVDEPDATAYDLQSYVWLLVTTSYPELRDASRALPYAKRAVEKATTPTTLDSLARSYDGLGLHRLAFETEHKALRMLPSPSAGEKPSALRMEIENNLARFQAAAANSKQ